MKYKAFVFDLDGTLYHQFPLRVLMVIRLGVYYLLRPHRLRELLLLRAYRKLRESLYGKGQRNFDALQLAEAARKCGMPCEDAQRVITEWMIYKPLGLVRIFRRRKLLSLIKSLQCAGKIIIVYSDYPVREKLQALGLEPDYAYFSNDPAINCMKPDPSGLGRVIKALGLDVGDMLYVGDRDNKDGECARGAGVKYMDVHAFEKKPPA